MSGTQQETADVRRHGQKIRMMAKRVQREERREKERGNRWRVKKKNTTIWRAAMAAEKGNTGDIEGGGRMSDATAEER